MAGIVQRIKAFLRSPRGQQFTARGKQWASNPRNRQRAKDMWNRRGRR